MVPKLGHMWRRLGFLDEAYVEGEPSPRGSESPSQTRVKRIADEPGLDRVENCTPTKLKHSFSFRKIHLKFLTWKNHL